MFGAILLAVVAVAVSIAIGPQVIAAAQSFFAGAGMAASAAAVSGGVVGGAVVGAASSIASQAVGVATGIQDSFSWKAVGLAALGGAISGGATGAFGKAANFVQAAVRGAATNALTQGIAKATGLQDKFSWAGVAAAGVGAGVVHLAGGNLPALGKGGDTSLSNHLAHLGTNAVSALANAATRSAIEGSNLGRNIVAAIPDVIGQAVGNALAGGVAGRNRPDQPRGQIAARSGPAGVMSDIGTAEDRAMAEALRQQQEPPQTVIVVTATPEQIHAAKKRYNFWDWIDSQLGTNLGGDNPSPRRSRVTESERRAAVGFEQRFAIATATNEAWRRTAVGRETVARREARQADYQVRLAAANRQLDYQIATAVTGPPALALGLATAAISAPGLAAMGGAEGAYLGSLARGSSGGEVTAGTLALDGGIGAATGLAGKYVLAQLGSRITSRFAPAAESVPSGVTVFRVEGSVNARFGIDDLGNVSLVPSDKTIWLNFGQEGRAMSYLDRKIAAGLPDAHAKSFDVDPRFLDEIRATAVPENLASRSPGAPIISNDPFPDQYGLRPDQFQRLMESIYQGSGKYVRIR